MHLSGGPLVHAGSRWTALTLRIFGAGEVYMEAWCQGQIRGLAECALTRMVLLLSPTAVKGCRRGPSR